MKAEVPEYAVQDEVAVDPSRTALVVIDMPNDFVKQGGSLLVPDAEASVRRSDDCSNSPGPARPLATALAR